MLLVIDEDLKNHLSFFKDVNPDITREFSRIAIEFISKGQQPKVYQSAAQKLNVDVDTVHHAVEGLMRLFTESAKLMLSELDFQDSLLSLGFTEEVRKVLFGMYDDKAKELRAILQQLSPDLPHYHNLEWRCDVRLASRCLHHQVVPLVTMKLALQNQGEVQHLLLETDPTNLVHLTDALVEALQESKSQHCRRICRNII